MVSKYSKNLERNFLLGISLVFLFLTIFVVKDIFKIIIYSFILSYFLYPLYDYYNSKIDSKRISSILTLGTSIIGLFIPFALLSYFLILNLIKIVVKYKEYIENPEILNGIISGFLEQITNSNMLSSIDFATIVNKGVAFIVDISTSFFSSIPQVILYFFVMLFISYYILIFNKDILKAINEYIPLSLSRQNKLINNIEKNVKVLFKGYFLTGIIQTLVALIGYLILGAPNVLIMTFLTMIVSLIPYLGTPLVWVPLGLYMMIIGNSFGGITLIIYGVFVISLIDNFLRPVLMSNKDTIHPALVFIGFVGGMIVFGISGIILGPLIISITAILLKYLQEVYETQQ